MFLSPDAEMLLGLQGPLTIDAFFAHIHPSDRMQIEAATAVFLEKGGALNAEFRVTNVGGAVSHIMIHATTARDGGIPDAPIQGILIDVTQSRRIGTMPQPETTKVLGHYDLDVQSGISRWDTELQSTFNDRFGVPITADMVRKSIHPDDRQRIMTEMQTLLATPGPFEMTFRVILPDGKSLKVRDNGRTHPPINAETGQVDRVTGQLTQIPDDSSVPTLTDDTFWRLIDTAPVGVYAVDANMKMARINQSGLATFAEFDGLIGRDIADVLGVLWPEPFASNAVAHFRHTLTTGERYDADPVIAERADRKLLEAYDWSIERIVMADGTPGVLCYFYDLTERVRAERAMEEQQARLRVAYDTADMGAWEVDLRTRRTTAAPRICAMFGEPDFTGDFSELFTRAIHPDDAARVDESFAASVATGIPFACEYRIITSDGLRFIASSGEAIFDSDGAASAFIGVHQDVTDRKIVELALVDSESRLRTVINEIVAFVGVLEPDGTLRDVNEPALEFGGISRSDVVDRPFHETHWWSHDPATAALCRDAVAAAQAGKTERFDVVVRGAHDSLVTIDFMLAPIFDENGAVEMLVASGFDISAREEARAREKELMGEINHRIKNILTLVQSVARQTARGSADDFLPRFEGRLRGLARAQDLLFESSADRVDLRDLITSQLSHFEDLAQHRISLSGPDVWLGPQSAQAIGMALHELGTNAGKYGALSTDAGQVTITWSLSSDDDTFEIVWHEQGGPPVTPPQSQGFGSLVIGKMTESIVGGEVTYTHAPAGVAWTLTCACSKLRV